MKNLGIELAKKCASFSNKGSNKMDGSHVTIFFNSDAQEWNVFVTKCLRHIFKELSLNEWNVQSQALEEIELPLTAVKIGAVKRTRLQIIILSPRFLDYVARHPTVVLGQLFDPQRVICLLCGVKIENITSTHRASLANFDSWTKMVIMDNDVDFREKFLRIFQKHINDSELESNGENARFKLNPCKVREGFSKVTIELEEPISNSNNVSIYLITENNDQIAMVVKQSNPYNLKIIIPDRFFAISQFVEILVKNNGEVLGQRKLKCESKMMELNHLLESLIDPLGFICQTLGLSSSRNDRDNLDRYLADYFLKEVPRCGFNAIDIGAEDSGPTFKSDHELPTLLHWSAKNGLQELSSVLLACPRAAVACQLRNCNDMTAADIAEANGFSCLANMLENFMKLSETAEMYIYMKSLTDTMHPAEYENREHFFERRRSAADSSGFFGSQSDENRKTISRGSHEKVNEKDELSKSLSNGDSDISLRAKPHLTRWESEIIQLFEDFKKSKYTMSQLESICHDLQRSHRSASFNEKQEKLKSLRQHFEQSQKSLQQEGQKLTLLKRLQTFFKKNKKESQSNPILTITSPKSSSDFESVSHSKVPTGHMRSTCSWSSGSRSSSFSDRSSGMSSESSVFGNREESLMVHNFEYLESSQSVGTHPLSLPDGRKTAKPSPPPRSNKSFYNEPIHDILADDDYCPLEPAPAPPTAACATESISTSNSHEESSYLVMAGSRLLPPTLPPSHNTQQLAEITSEPDYYNLPAVANGSLGCNRSDRAHITYANLNAIRTPLYENVFVIRDFDSDRFDSVPDEIAPAIPVDSLVSIPSPVTRLPYAK